MAFDLDNLTVFLAAVDTGSFSAAARALGRVPSAVSMAIANLEAELGLQLFDRSGREPRPSAHAQALLPQARLLVEGLHALNIHALSLHQGLESVLKLAMVQDGRADLALVFERYGMDASERFQEVAQETLVAVLASHHPLLQRMPASGIRDEHLLAEPRSWSPGAMPPRSTNASPCRACNGRPIIR
jgi:DNA-binding transcriptional LysR family regulator